MQRFLRLPLLGILVILMAGCSALTTANRQLARQAYSEAALSYREYLKVHPDTIRAQIGLGEALLLTGDIQGAIAALTKAIPDAEHYPETILLMGLANLKKGDYESALDYLGAFTAPGYDAVVQVIESGRNIMEEALEMHGDETQAVRAAAEHYATNVYDALTRQRIEHRRNAGKVSGGSGDGGNGGGG